MRSPSPAAIDRAGLPPPERLAAVATVLCVYPRRHRDALDGWLQAARAERLVRVDALGECEAMLFHDARGRACWRLYLLPDSDFLAWDDAAGVLPAHRGREARTDAWAGLRRRWLRRVRGRWRAEVLRLRVLHAPEGQAVLVADSAALSALGHAHARRIAAGEGAALRRQTQVCCCLASAAPGDAPAWPA